MHPDMETTEKNDEVFIEILIQASPERVYQAWTDPGQLIRWYAPEGCSIRFKELDIREGGNFHSCIHNPEYGDCWAIGVYLELIPNRKIVFSLINADEKGNRIEPASIGMDKDWPGETLVCILLSEEDGKTRLQLQQTVSSALARKTGAYPSWIQMLEKMESTILEAV